MSTEYKLHHETVTLTLADTEYEVYIGAGDRDLSFKLGDAAVAWRWSTRTNVVAGGGGYPVAAAGEVKFDGPLRPQTIYVACSSAGEVLHVTKAYAINR